MAPLAGSQVGAERLACFHDRPFVWVQVPLSGRQSSLLRQWKRWEAGEAEPDRGKSGPFYKPIIAATFGLSRTRCSRSLPSGTQIQKSWRYPAWTR